MRGNGAPPNCGAPQQRFFQEERSGLFRSVLFDHLFKRNVGVDDDRHALSRLRSRRRSSSVEGPSRRPMMRRISASRRAERSRSRPTAFASARRACSSVEVPQAAARRRNASITAASILRITICPIGGLVYADIDIDAKPCLARSQQQRMRFLYDIRKRTRRLIDEPYHSSVNRRPRARRDWSH